MPIYEYHCNTCEVNFEKIVSSSTATEPINCEKCSSQNVVKKISVGNYRLSSSTATTIPSGALSGCSSSSGFS
nr:zinc ribbon domain-containing protein [Desulfobulbaceae bacterium]